MPLPSHVDSHVAAMVKHPTFIWWIAVIVQLPLQIFFSVWTGGFFGAVAGNAFGLHGPKIFIAGGLVAFVGVPCVACIGKKLNFMKTEYRFFADRFEFEEGFFSKSEKVIAYRNVREISLRKGLLQRSRGLGTIYLGTLATGSNVQSNPFERLGLGSVSASGVYVRDITEPDATFERLQDLLAKHTGDHGDI